METKSNLKIKLGEKKMEEVAIDILENGAYNVDGVHSAKIFLLEQRIKKLLKKQSFESLPEEIAKGAVDSILIEHANDYPKFNEFYQKIKAFSCKDKMATLRGYLLDREFEIDSLKSKRLEIDYLKCSFWVGIITFLLVLWMFLFRSLNLLK